VTFTNESVTGRDVVSARGVVSLVVSDFNASPKMIGYKELKEAGLMGDGRKEAL
jgi:hypothetical protein